MPKKREIDEITGKAIEAKVFRRLLPYLRPHLLGVFTAIGVLLITVGIALYTPRLLGQIVDEALVPRNRELLIRLAMIFVGLELLWTAAKVFEGYLLQSIGQDVMQKLRMDLFGRLMRMPMRFYDRNPTGRLVTRVSNDTANLMEIFGAGFVTLIADILVVTGVLVAMLFLDWRLGLVAVSMFPVMALAMNHFSKRLRVSYREARSSLSFMNSFFAERMGGMPTVQLMNMEAHERKRFDALSEDYFVKQMGSVNVFAFFHPSITMLTALSIALTLYFGGGYVIDKSVPIGVFVSFLAYVQVLFQPVRGLTEKYNIYQNAMSSAERIFGALDLQEEDGLREISTASGKAPRLSGAIHFDHVWFSYAESSVPWALRDANFKISPQERIAVVGHSGAGKSTLLSLLFRFYQPQKGTILLDEKPIESYGKHFLRRRLGFVQQDVFIFAGTIRENLALLGENISEERMIAACKSTGMDRIVARLDAGFETKLDERGSNLSLGERQVLAITRVLLQDPDILILDEATSHVDNATERMLQRAIGEVTKNRTSILIAHRLSTIRDANRIFVFENGALVESGTHESLLAQNGAYRAFSSSQSL